MLKLGDESIIRNIHQLSPKLIWKDRYDQIVKNIKVKGVKYLALTSKHSQKHKALQPSIIPTINSPQSKTQS